MYNEAMYRLGRERSVIRELFEYGNARKREIGEENVFDFSLGNPSIPTPSCVRDELLHLVQDVPAEVLHGYTSAAGDMGVREKIASYIKETFHVPAEKELIYLTCGAAAALAAVFRAVCNEGDEVIVLTPFFPEYRIFIEGAGAKCVPVPTDERFHLDIAAIRRAITSKTRAFVLNSPNNPTGAIYSEQELTALGELLSRVHTANGKILLVADEPYRELTYGTPVPYPAKFYPETVVCYSFSKSLSLPGERIGYVSVSPSCEEAEALFAAICGAGRALGYVCAPALFQRVTAECLGKCADIGIYRRNRDLLYHALTEMGYTVVPPEGAFYLFMKALGPSAAAFSLRAREEELLLVPSESFGCEGYVRIAYCVSPEMAERSLPAFRRLIQSYKE